MDSIRSLSRQPYANVAAIAGLSTLGLSALVWCVQDYRAYLALGPGGPPYNVFGWAMITSLRPFILSSSGAFKVSDYSQEGAHQEIRDLPVRKGERAKVGGIAPHRQLSQHPPDEMKQYITNMFANAVTQNPQLLKERTSLYEKHNTALFVRDELLSADAAETARVSRGEIGHVHPDYSIHLYLSPADARVVMEKGWAERHRMAKPHDSMFKNMFNVADTYLMVYGPRNEEELDIVGKILQSSIRFMTGHPDVQLPEWQHRQTSAAGH